MGYELGGNAPIWLCLSINRVSPNERFNVQPEIRPRSGSNKGVIITNEDGTETRYESIAKACKLLNMQRDTVWSLIKSGKRHKYKKFKMRYDESEGIDAV